MTLAELAARFPKVAWNATKDAFLLPCPRHPNSKILGREHDDGRLELRCHSGCTAEQILSAVGPNGNGNPPAGTSGKSADRGQPLALPEPSTKQRPGSPGKPAFAIAYARHGIPVFRAHWIKPGGRCSCVDPECGSPGKHPLETGWQELATADESVIREWWKRTPEANVGVLCGQRSNLTVLDVDGDAGRGTLRELEIEHGELPETPHSLTGSGGDHYYFIHDPTIRNSVRFAPGLDTRSGGGFVVGVGSRNVHGEYLWAAGYSLADLTPAKMPQWLVELTTHRTAQDNGHFQVPDAPVHEGEGRNSLLYRLCRSLKARNLPESAIRAAVEETNRRQCQPPLVPRELSALLTNALRQPDRAGFASNGGADIANRAPEEQYEPLRTLTLGALYDMAEDWKSKSWVWEGILPHSSLSLLVGKSESGKSTFIYALIYSIVTGQMFLGRQCERGRVVYIAGDPASEFVAAETFARLGLGRDEGVLTIPESLVGNPRGISDLRTAVQEFKPILIIGDTLAATVKLDEGKYGESYGAQRPLVAIARDFGPNFLLAHHSQKAAVDSYNVIDLALGSVGVAAVASTRMATRKYKRGKNEFYTFEMSHLRIGEPIQGEWVIEKRPDGMIEFNGLWAERETGIVRDKILSVLGEATEPMTPTALREEMGMGMDRRTKMWVQEGLRALLKEKLVEKEKGTGHGNRWRYKIAAGKGLNPVGKANDEFGNAPPTLQPQAKMPFPISGKRIAKNDPTGNESHPMAGNANDANDESAEVNGDTVFDGTSRDDPNCIDWSK